MNKLEKNIIIARHVESLLKTGFINFRVSEEDLSRDELVRRADKISSKIVKFVEDNDLDMPALTIMILDNSCVHFSILESPTAETESVYFD